jgi:RNA polymerase sigma factor (sigma-70 family)
VGHADEAIGPSAARERRRADAAVALLARHESAFRRTARRVSICADDADDALARAVEILLTKAPPLEPPTLAAWMHVVTRREALAVRRARERQMGGHPAPEMLFEALECDAPRPDELAHRRARHREAMRALRRLKPSERIALFLQAYGYTYAEIQRHCGWTYTKVNRCLAEGRARLRGRSADAG